MTDFERQIEAIGLTHLKAKKDELESLLVDIDEAGFTKAYQVVGLINNSLDRVNEALKERESEQ